MRNRVRKKRKQQKQMRFIICMLLLVIWTILGIIGLFTVVNSVFGIVFKSGFEKTSKEIVLDKTSFEYDEEKINQGEDMNIDEDRSQKLTEDKRTKCKEIYQRNRELLVLVNKDHELDVNYDPKLRTICNGRLEASDRMYEDLTRMLHTAGAEGYDYWIASAYRSRQRQQQLIDEDVRALMQKGWNYDDAMRETLRETMPAGYSEHETGLALDILCSSNTSMDESQANEPGNQWLVEHCSEYGFILRYPKDKETVTEINYEPWHFRYVGVDAAKEMQELGLCLEEFIEMIEREQV